MTALDFWRKAYPVDRAPSPCDCKMPFGRALTSEEDTWSLAPTMITSQILRPENGVLHILTQDADDLRSSRSVKCHLWRNAFPENSFYQLGDQAYIASPQFAFLQMAQQLTLTQLIALGDELCGLYSFDEDAKHGMRQRRTPLVTINDLREFVARARAMSAGQARSAYGIRKAERALEFIVERSASPRETALEMFLALPYRMGGYGFEAPLMNLEITLTPEAAAIAGRGRKTLRADLLFTSKNYILEYDGDEPHAGIEAGLSDRARANALELMGYHVMELTHEQLNHQERFELMVKHLAKQLGKRLDPKKLGRSPERMNLRNEVFSWNKACGHAR